MAIIVYVPTPLRRLTDGQAKVEASGQNVAEAIEELEARFPGFKGRVCDETGEIKRFINVFVNGEEIRALQGRATALQDGDEVSIIPAMAGGVNG
jgi:molybdopterin synthase sulfur carrier subunit